MFFLVILLILLCLYLAAFIVSMLIVVKAARDKGYTDLSGRLWFIGLFGLIFTPAIIVAALPDKTQRIEDQPDLVLPTL